VYSLLAHTLLAIEYSEESVNVFNVSDNIKILFVKLHFGSEA
jgi:hypothetical protein